MLGVLTFNKKKKNLKKGASGIHENPKNAGSHYRMRKLNCGHSLMQGIGQRPLLLPAQVSPIFLSSLLKKSTSGGEPTRSSSRDESKDRQPISVLTLLRFYLVQARDLELLRRKEKKERWLLLSNMSFQSL